MQVEVRPLPPELLDPLLVALDETPVPEDPLEEAELLEPDDVLPPEMLPEPELVAEPLAAPGGEVPQADRSSHADTCTPTTPHPRAALRFVMMLLPA
jgi:hypothetical protein